MRHILNLNLMADVHATQFILRPASHSQVICWELLTTQKFYACGADMNTVVEILRGEQQLPSEKALSETVLRNLGNAAMRQSILSMLDRDFTKRPSISSLLSRWNSVFEHTS
jgi:hypothetical protein